MTPEGVLCPTSPPGPRATIWWLAPGGCWGSRASDTRGRSIPRHRCPGSAPGEGPPACSVSWTTSPTHTGTFRLGIITLTDDAAGARIAEHLSPPETVRCKAAGAAVGPVPRCRRWCPHGRWKASAPTVWRGAYPVHPRATEITVFSFSVSPTPPPTGPSRPWSRGGTYVRALIRDLGSGVRCLRHRAPPGAAGAFRLPAAAVTGDEEADARSWRDAVVPLRGGVPLALPALALADRSSPAASGWAPLPWTGAGEGEVAVRDSGGELLGVPGSSPPLRPSAPGSSRWACGRLRRFQAVVFVHFLNRPRATAVSEEDARCPDPGKQGRPDPSYRTTTWTPAPPRSRSPSSPSASSISPSTSRPTARTITHGRAS